MGTLAAQRLFARIERPRQRAHHVLVESELVVRGSTAAPAIDL
jgi:DNA-binding LacI/PurR family transcriptional regulator